MTVTGGDGLWIESIEVLWVCRVLGLNPKPSDDRPQLPPPKKKNSTLKSELKLREKGNGNLTPLPQKPISR